MAEVKQLPADVARCQNEHCSKRNTCLRFLSPSHERQVYMFRQDPDGCEDYIEVDQETQE
jgi:hypothetical protein